MNKDWKPTLFTWFVTALKRVVGLGPKCPHCKKDLIPMQKMFHVICSKCRRIIR